jgi:chromatin assembly factor 1 subunit B
LFHDDTFQSFYRRLDFSPDGEILAVPSGVLEMEGETAVANCTYLFTKANLAK